MWESHWHRCVYSRALPLWIPAHQEEQHRQPAQNLYGGKCTMLSSALRRTLLLLLLLQTRPHHTQPGK